MQDRWKARRSGTGTPGAAKGGGGPRSASSGGTGGARPVNNGNGWTAPGDRVGFWDAVYETAHDRWKKRRDHWKANGGPRHRPSTGKGSSGKGSASNRGTGRGAGTGAGGSGPGYGPRTSPFDADSSGPTVTITVEQVDPPGTHAKRWEPTAVGTGQRQLPRQGPPALPRAPQRPAGQRPGTTRRKDPIPMPAAPARTGAVSVPVAATVPAPGGMAARHATEIRLDDALKALTLLTTAGMETHDECAELARQARRLLSELETMAHDLAANHNVSGPRTLRAVAVLMETVGQLVVQAERMAKASLDAAETAEAEETAMARDYRPTQAATIDAGLATPSARIHNEN
ncbi:hypothetical protein N8I84_41880 (plasmid) [Streptomyces cynarae]|uniref:ATP/GTP-binding protein n=1 Tax=Streptomyces cynarae TaxID=2981134 RepID=A0ABY6EE97_9ACTN|nr:hypothetical protein [Streptomyces cynarae]UXY24985.1 hypothetical protein N8I84_41880 [Streptomyces cynarae]